VAANSTVTVSINVGPKMAKVPNGLVGKDVDDAKKALESADFTVKVQDAQTEPADAKKDEVLTVEPAEGESAPLGSEVVLTVATGQSEVPNFIGSSRQRAEDDAKAAGFDTPSFTEKESDQPAGTVIEQDPKAGTKVSRNTDIKLTVAIPKPEPSPAPEPSSTNAPPVPTPTPSGDPTASASSTSG
jgi:serine/threonine-protein kinase